MTESIYPIPILGSLLAGQIESTIHVHWEQEKSQPECPLYQWEKRIAEFPTERWNQLRVGIFLSSLKISDRFFFSHAIKKTLPSSLVGHMDMPKQNEEK